ncbi:C4b-binding protein alpha chain-like isoform X2 [Mixophyes fleayi]|uniref:C4b-binding protein alpha chain-like isoform X2 n=1 Tax=Mixophyes fleayi TaxID=3061075 RepID=UPI003F4DC4FC
MFPASYTIERPCVIFLYFVLLISGAWGDCGLPPVLEHTKEVKETSGIPGQAVVYSCDRNTGYYDLPDKSKTITCQDDNTWSKISVFCARACNVPERIPFAEPKPNDLDLIIFLPDTKVSYNCRPGFSRVPGTISSIICLQNYTWSQPDTFCQRRSCGSPGEVLNGEAEATDYLFGSRVTYKCNDGYRLSSKRNYRDCQANGVWTNVLPDCEAVICSAPETPTDGSFNPYKDEYMYADAVTFSCKRGLELVGARTVSCTADGRWSSTSPTCIAVECSDPVVPQSRKLSGFVGPYTLNYAVRFECLDDYVMNGFSSITCSINSQWEPEVPKCLTVCGSPPTFTYADLDNRFANLTNYFSGTTVQYNCKQGYERDLNKNNTMTCSGRSWSKPDQFCSPISCGDPGEVTNAHMSAPDFLFGTRAIYTCVKGYVMKSALNYRECQVDGTWSTADLACRAVCNPPPTFPYAELDESFANLPNYFSGTTVQYNCKQGYKRDPNKDNSITCLVNSWYKPDQFCSPVCNPPPTIPDAELDKRFANQANYFSGTTVQYNCINGYERDPSKNNTITCLGKSWSKPDQFCTTKSNLPTIIGSISGCAVAVILSAVVACSLYNKHKKSGDYYCEYKNDKKIEECKEPALKPKSDTLNV